MTPLLKRLLLWSVPTVALAAGLVVAFQPQPLAVDMVEVRRGAMAVRVEAEGRTRVREIYRVSSPVAGEVERLSVKVGDRVEPGDGLAVVRPAAPGFLDQRSEAEAQAAVAAAEAAGTEAAAAVRRAKAAADYADAELARIAVLADNGTVSRRMLDQARSDAAAGTAALDSAVALLDVRRHELEAARARLMQPENQAETASCCVHVRAPAEGRVLALLQESQAVVPAGTPLVEIGDPTALEVVADFLSSDAVKIEAGASAILDDWGGPPQSGTVRSVEPTAFTEVSALGIDEQRVNVILDFAAPPPPSLGHGFHIMARVVVWSSEDALIVPLGALFRNGDGWAVFRVDDGIARSHQVEVARMGADQAALSAGLAEGDTLILHPSDRVAEGVRVDQR